MSRRGEFLRRVTALSFIATCLWAMCLSPAVAAEFSLTKVADFNTAIPNGTGNFTNFFNSSPGQRRAMWPSREVAASGSKDSTCSMAAHCDRVADRSTPIPDGTGNFTDFYWLALSGTNVLFGASGSSGHGRIISQGLYLFDGTALLRVADTNTPIPDGTGNFKYTRQRRH